MNLNESGGTALRQTTLARAAGCGSVPPAPHASATKKAERQPARPGMLLTSAQAAAEVFGVSERTFHSFRQQSWFADVVRPRVLSPRVVRWVRAELETAALNCPTVTSPEPERLVRGRLAKASRRPAPDAGQAAA